jgi:competence ComEA-like helix-hairpin-helix protein
LTDARPTALDPEKVLTKALDLNKADAVQLSQVPEIGAKLAPAIVAYRQSRGGFGSVEELLNVPGIGTKKLERIREWVYVEDGCRMPSANSTIT